MKKFDGQIRQGDVLLHAFDGDIPDGAKIVEPRNGRYVIAEGEATGHAHVITDTDSVTVAEKDGVLYLRVESEVPISHEEHGIVTATPRVYTRPPQTEWSSAMEPRRVLD